MLGSGADTTIILAVTLPFEEAASPVVCGVVVVADELVETPATEVVEGRLKRVFNDARDSPVGVETTESEIKGVRETEDAIGVTSLFSLL